MKVTSPTERSTMSDTDLYEDDEAGWLAEDAPPPSMRAAIAALAPGETYARAARFDADATPKRVPMEVLQGLRLSTQATVLRVRQQTGSIYTVEGGEFRTASRDTVVCLAVTRLS